MGTEYRITIDHVDGGNSACVHPDPERVLDFLKREDHEGSFVQMHIQALGEDAYKLLEAITSALRMKPTTRKLIDAAEKFAEHDNNLAQGNRGS